MPTYRNNTNHSVISWRDINFRKNKNVELDFFVPYIDLGLDLIDNNPLVQTNLILISGDFSDEIIEIPYNETITITTTTASSASLLFGDSVTPVFINAAVGYTVTARWEDVAKIKIDGDAYVVVERVR